MVLSLTPTQDSEAVNPKPKKVSNPEFDSYQDRSKSLIQTLRKTAVLSLIPAQVRSKIPALNLRKAVVLSFIPDQESRNPNPKKISAPEFDSHPRQ